MEETNITIIGTLTPDMGISPYCYELLRGFKEINYKVQFIGFKSLYPRALYKRVTSSNPNMRLLEESEISNLQKFHEIIEVLTWYNPITWIKAILKTKGNIVHLQWWSYILAPIYLFLICGYKLQNKKIILTVHNITPHENNKLSSILNSIVLHFANYYIVHGQKNKQKLWEKHSIPPEKIYVVDHGILHEEKLQRLSKKMIYDKNHIKGRLGLPLKSKVILFFGNIRDYKGLDDLLYAFKALNKEIPNTVLIIAGRAWRWDRYQHIIEKLKIRNVKLHLEFIPLEKVPYYFLVSDVVVLPYKHFDSQTGVAGLAIFFKKPLVVTNVGGLGEYIIQKYYSPVPPGNVSKLSDTIKMLLCNPKIVKKIKYLSKHLEYRIKWSNIGKKHRIIYSHIIKLANAVNSKT